jgi:hypothetical protein
MKTLLVAADSESEFWAEKLRPALPGHVVVTSAPTGDASVADPARHGGRRHRRKHPPPRKWRAPPPHGRPSAGVLRKERRFTTEDTEDTEKQERKRIGALRAKRIKTLFLFFSVSSVSSVVNFFLA